MFSKLILILIPLLLLVSCKVNQESLDKHAEITSNLREYEDDAFFQENYKDTVLTDYMHMSYEAYREKYGLKHRHMDLVARTSEISIATLKAHRTIEKSRAIRDSIKRIGRIDTSRINTYSFDKIVPFILGDGDTIQPIDTSSVGYKIMLEYDSDTLK